MLFAVDNGADKRLEFERSRGHGQRHELGSGPLDAQLDDRALSVSLSLSLNSVKQIKFLIQLTMRVC